MEESGQLHGSVALPPVPIGDEAGWAPETIRTLWSIQKSLSPAGIAYLSKIAGKRAYVWCLQRAGPFTTGLT
jgi:hypothetical protein